MIGDSEDGLSQRSVFVIGVARFLFIVFVVERDDAHVCFELRFALLLEDGIANVHDAELLLASSTVLDAVEVGGFAILVFVLVVIVIIAYRIGFRLVGVVMILVVLVERRSVGFIVVDLRAIVDIIGIVVDGEIVLGTIAADHIIGFTFVV